MGSRAVLLACLALVAPAVALVAYGTTPLPFQNAKGQFLLLDVIVSTGSSSYLAPWYVGDTVTEAAGAFCIEFGAVHSVSQSDCSASVEHALMEHLSLVATRADGTARSLFGSTSTKANSGVLMSLHYATDELSARAADMNTNAGLLLSLNKRVARVEDALTTSPAAASGQCACARATGAPDDAVTLQHTGYRPDKCAPMYATYDKTALNDVDARPGLRISLHGGVEGPPLLRSLRHRLEFPSLLNAMHLTGEGVEVGVSQGGFSAHILSHWTGRKLHLVDHWERGGIYGVDRQADFELTISRVSPFVGRYEVHRELSATAALKFADGSLDFVYLDALHSYRDCMNDILSWFPKLKVGGLFLGDDYFNGIVEQGKANFGVRDAVDEFAALHGYRVYDTREDDCAGFCPNWYMIKC